MPGGLVPCDVITEEILIDHPDRFRAIVIDSSNPAHSWPTPPPSRGRLPRSNLVVFIGIALTEHLPPAPRVLDPLPGSLPEPEIYARLVREPDAVPRGRLTVLRAAARLGRPVQARLRRPGRPRQVHRRQLILHLHVCWRVLSVLLPSGFRLSRKGVLRFVSEGSARGRLSRDAASRADPAGRRGRHGSGDRGGPGRRSGSVRVRPRLAMCRCGRVCRRCRDMAGP